MIEPPASEVRDRVVELLAYGPLPVADIVADLDAQGLLDEWRDDGVSEEHLGRALIDEVVVTDEIWVDAREERLALTDLLTDGMVLTHRLTSDELNEQRVWRRPDAARPRVRYPGRDHADHTPHPGRCG